MGFYIFLIIVIVTSGFLAIKLDRRRLSRQATEKMTGERAEKAAKEISPGFASRITGPLSGLRDRITKRHAQPDMARLFRTWVAESLTKPKELKDWLASLSDEGIAALSQQLAEFCADLNVELSWLLEHKLDQDPELKKTVEGIVVSYCTACLEAARAQEALHSFRTLQAFEQNPAQFRELNQALLGKLVDEGLASAPSISALLALSQKERQAQVIQTIQEAAKANREAFVRVFKEATAELQAAHSATEAESSEEAEVATPHEQPAAAAT